MGPPENQGLDDGMLGFWFVHPSKEIKVESWDLSHSRAELLRIVIELSGDAATRRYKELVYEYHILISIKQVPI